MNTALNPLSLLRRILLYMSCCISMFPPQSNRVTMESVEYHSFSQRQHLALKNVARLVLLLIYRVVY